MLNNKMACSSIHTPLPGGGFHGGEQTTVLPGGGFHGEEQTEVLPGGCIHGGEPAEPLPGGGTTIEGVDKLPTGAWD